MRPGLYCGLILLTSIENGEPLAFINDGDPAAHAGRRRRRHRRQIHGERRRRGGRHARLRRHGAHPHAGLHARAQDQEAAGVQPDAARTARRSAARWRRTTTSRCKVCDRPEDVYKGAHIVAALTDSAVPGDRRQPARERRAHRRRRRHRQARRGEPRTRSTSICASATRRRRSAIPSLRPTPSTSATRRGRCKASTATAAREPPQARHRAARPARHARRPGRRARRRAARPPDQITYSERGNLQGAQFYAVAGKVYELPSAPGSAARFRPSGSCRTSATENDIVQLGPLIGPS